MKHYGGVVVGGPRAGRWLESEMGVFYADTYAPVLLRGPAPADERINFEQHIYRWRALGEDIGVWAEAEMSPEDIFRERVQAYHPSVK